MAVVTEPIILDETGQDIVTQLQAIVAGLAPNAGQISYSNATSGLSADDVQEALDEIDGNVDTLSNSLTQKVNVVTLSTSVEVTYSDPSTIGYRTTETTKVDVTSLAGYPMGKTVVATLAYGTEIYGDIAFVDNANYLRMASKTSGTKGAKVVVMYY